MTSLASPPITPDPHWPPRQPLRLEGVHVVRGEVEILQGVDLTFEPDQRYVVVGPSGSGKSTLARLLNRLEDPSQGRLWIGSVPERTLPIRTVRRAVGLVFQNPRALPGTVRANLSYPCLVRNLPSPADDLLVHALEEVGLDRDLLDRDADILSGGERQRLALAVALIVPPEILVLDEPTSGLDPSSARRIADVLEHRVRNMGLRTIVVTHHRQHATWLGDRAVVLKAGRVTDVGPITEVFQREDAEAWRPAVAKESV